MDELKKLKELDKREIFFGVERGDDRIRNSIRIAICRMIPLSFNVLFTEQDSIDFDPALFSCVADKKLLLCRGRLTIPERPKSPKLRFVRK